jgi:hypothetical protein
MSKRYYMYRLIDDKSGDELFQGQVEIPEQTGSETMNDDDARSMVADAAIRKMIRSSVRPLKSLIQYCELQGSSDARLTGEGDSQQFDWARCEPQELELKLGEED